MVRLRTRRFRQNAKRRKKKKVFKRVVNPLILKHLISRQDL